jgi:large subunit ribosomal protein L21
MYAVIRAGGKQLKVKPGDLIQVELMEHPSDGAVSFSPLLVVDDEGNTLFGRDLREATVKGRLVGEEKGPKVKVFKYKSKTGYSRRQGHRQRHTLLEIREISLSAPPAPSVPAEAEQEAEQQAP